MMLFPNRKNEVSDMAKKPTYEELEAQVLRLKDTERELREMEEMLQDRITLWQLLIEQSKDGIVVLDENGSVYAANKHFAEMLGYTEEELRRLRVWEWDGRLPKEELLQYLRSSDESGHSLEARHRRKDGSLIDVEFSYNGALYNGRKLVFCVHRDISARKRMEQELRESERKYRELCIVDDLTNLYNARHFHGHLKMEINRANRYGQPLSLLFFDLDDFKKYNDVYGHVEGDKVLSRTGEVVKRGLRQTDSAFRYGGEEFAVILPTTDLPSAITAAERLADELYQEVFSPVSGKDVRITCSIGVALYRPNEDPEDFVQRADLLMYKAKDEGKNRVCAEPLP